MPDLNEHDERHEQRHRGAAIGALISAARTASSIIRARAGSDLDVWALGHFLRDAADRAERAIAPEGGATRARAQLDRYVDDDGSSTGEAQA